MLQSEKLSLVINDKMFKSLPLNDDNFVFIVSRFSKEQFSSP